MTEYSRRSNSNRKNKKTSKRDHYSKPKKKHTVLKVILGLIITLILVLAAGGFWAYSQVKSTYNKSTITAPKTTAVSLNKTTPFTTLVLETQTVNGKKEILAAVVSSTNPKTNQTTFANFPISHTLPDSSTIQQTFAESGENGVLEKTQTLLNTKINKVVYIDINNIGQLIEATGGVSIQNPKGFTSAGYKFDVGTVDLTTAEQVSAYITPMNAEDTANAIKRTQDLSMLLYANLSKIAHNKNDLLNVNQDVDILKAISSTIKTNVSFKELRVILMDYRNALTKTSKLNLHDTNGTIPQEEMDKVKDLFNATLK